MWLRFVCVVCEWFVVCVVSVGVWCVWLCGVCLVVWCVSGGVVRVFGLCAWLV